MCEKSVNSLRTSARRSCSHLPDVACRCSIVQNRKARQGQMRRASLHQALLMRPTAFPSTMYTLQSSRIRRSIPALLAWSLDVLRTWEHRSQGRHALLQLDGEEGIAAYDCIRWTNSWNSCGLRLETAQ